MNEAYIRNLTEKDLDAVAALESLCFAEPWSASSLRLLLGEAAVGYVCLQNDIILGYGGMLYALDEGQITNIAVHPNARRGGHGRAILTALIADAIQKGLEQIALEVRRSNEAAIALYQGAGFFEAGIRKGFYKHPTEDALVMLKSLKEDD